MHIFIDNRFEEPTSIEVDPDDTIEQVKDSIRCVMGIPTDDQRLVFNSKMLNDNATVASYGIKPDDTVHVILTLRKTLKKN